MVWVPDGPGVTGRAALASQQKVVPRQSSTNRQSLGANRNSGPERRRGRQRPSKRGCFLVSLSLSLSGESVLLGQRRGLNGMVDTMLARSLCAEGG